MSDPRDTNCFEDVTTRGHAVAVQTAHQALTLAERAFFAVPSAEALGEMVHCAVEYQRVWVASEQARRQGVG